MKSRGSPKCSFKSRPLSADSQSTTLFERSCVVKTVYLASLTRPLVRRSEYKLPLFNILSCSFLAAFELLRPPLLDDFRSLDFDLVVMTRPSCGADLCLLE